MNLVRRSISHNHFITGPCLSEFLWCQFIHCLAKTAVAVGKYVRPNTQGMNLLEAVKEPSTMEFDLNDRMPRSRQICLPIYSHRTANDH